MIAEKIPGFNTEEKIDGKWEKFASRIFPDVWKNRNMGKQAVASHAKENPPCWSRGIMPFLL